MSIDWIWPFKSSKSSSAIFFQFSQHSRLFWLFVLKTEFLWGKSKVAKNFSFRPYETWHISIKTNNFNMKRKIFLFLNSFLKCVPKLYENRAKLLVILKVQKSPWKMKISCSATGFFVMSKQLWCLRLSKYSYSYQKWAASAQNNQYELKESTMRILKKSVKGKRIFCVKSGFRNRFFEIIFQGIQ